jgi:hypothetical protein
LANKPYERNPAFPRWPYHFPGKQGIASNLAERRNTRLVTTPVILGVDSGPVTLPGAAGAILLKLTGDVTDVWFRLYGSEADMTADAARGIDDTPATPILLDVLFSSPDDMEIRLTTQDMPGIPVFNWEERALDRLWYKVISDPLVTTVYTETFLGDPDGSQATGSELRLDTEYPDFDHQDDAGTRPRYYVQFDQVRPFGVEDYVARIAGIAVNPTTNPLLMNATVWRSNTVDTTTFAAMLCAYLNNSGTLGSWDTLYVRGGIVRDSATHVKARIELVNGSGVVSTLAESAAIAWGSGVEDRVSFIIDEVNGVLTGLVYTGYPPNMVLRTSAAIPSAVQVANHDMVGIFLSAAAPGGEPLAFGGVTMADVGVYKNPISVNIDIGYVPIEKPGGTLEPE